MKPNFSTLGSIIENSREEPKIRFLADDSIRKVLELSASTIYEEYNLSPYPVDIVLYDNVLHHCDIAQGNIFRGKRSRIFQKIPIDVRHVYKYNEKFRGGVQRYMLGS